MASITLTVNDVEYTVGPEISSSTTLVEYLRNCLQLRGTKYMCYSGRCGACIVSVVKTPGGTAQSVNACLVAVASCHGWNITTVEKVGNRCDGYHSLQTTLAKNNGTQCGYCTPGWIMSMYSLLKGKSEVTMREIEDSLGSNLCRCTGYRPILQAFRQFASDAPVSSIMDIEDVKICDKTGNRCCKGKGGDGGWCHVTREDVTAQSIINVTLADGKEWYRVNELNDIFDVLNLRGDESYMLVHGNTARGLTPIDDYPSTIIDISGIQALKGSVMDQNLEIGAGMTITEMEEVFKTMSSKEGFGYLKEYNELLKFVANVPVKNIGSVGGNLMITHKNNASLSDLYIMFATVGADVTILNQSGVEKTVSMMDFLKEEMRGKVLVRVVLPPLSKKYKLMMYKIAGKVENAGTIVHAGFLYKLDSDYTVQESRLFIGNQKLMRATNTERYIRHKKLFKNETLQGAINVLQNEIIVTDKQPATSGKFRKNLSIALFYKSILAICPPSILDSRYRSGGNNLRRERPVSKARQTFGTDESLYPLGQPIPKVEALVQCAGEAVFCDDVPSLPREVFAAFVLSTVSLGTIENIDASNALSISGVIAFYTAKDIPGINSFTPGIAPASTTNEEVLCDGEVKYYNQPIGIIVAETRYLADKAAKYVTVTYKNTKQPVINIKEAKDDSKRTVLFNEIKAKETGNDVFKVIKGDISIHGQYHTCMETLVCVSKPTEEGIEVNVATQSVDTVQLMTSRALNIPLNKIDVRLRRVGGSYGFKISRATQVAVACNLVVQKLNRPCRFIQSLKTNMRAAGKRFPCFANFEVSVNKEGLIQYNDYQLYEDNGYIVNEPLIGFTLDCYSNCYNNINWNYKAFNTITDLPSNTWCRSPGSVEAAGITELMMEQISYELSLDPVEVRLLNLNSDEHGAVKEILETLKTDANYLERRNAVDTYNKENRWKKRGLRFAFMIWNPYTLPNYLNVHLSVFVGDGTVSITHGGVEMGQGINTKAVQICAHLLNIPVENVQVKTMDTNTCPNNYVTGGSVMSQNVGLGVLRCCNELLKKLEPIKSQMDNPTWVELIKKAAEEGVDLQTHGFVDKDDNVAYSAYGVALAEVEVDILTGEHEILRLDLSEDVGCSVSPEIDIGQIEGAFIMGLGYWTSEKLVYNKDSGELMTDTLNQYWVPQVKDIPQDFRIYFKKNSYTDKKIMGSKAVGEPATCLGVVVPLAIREALVSARSETGMSSTEWFKIDGPYTIEAISMAASARSDDFKLY